MMESGEREVSDSGIGEILSVSQATKLLRIHRNTLYKLIREGELPAFRFSRSGPWKFRREDLADWIQVKQVRGHR